MKKMILIAVAALYLGACNTTETDTTTTDSLNAVRTDENDMSAMGDTSMSMSTTTGAYTPAEGDVIYTERKLRVWRGGMWTDADSDVTLDNGVVVNRNGRVRRADREIELKEGEIVNRTGNFFDRSGRAIENAWDETKEEAKNAGRAIKKAANKVGEKAKDVVDDNDPK